MNFTFLRTACAAAAIGLAGVGAQAADITGAGATFPFPIYAKWAQTYKHETGNSLNYQSIGSGGGIKQIKAKTVTFGATDAPLKPDDLDTNPASRNGRWSSAASCPSSTSTASPTAS